MKKIKLICHKDFQIGKVDKRIYGSFVEHMGRVVYSGIYEPGHRTADEDGFRMDVMDAVQELSISSVRYPGGNFVSAYHWEDGVGPRDKRPSKLEPAWKALETNEFGTDEFIRWCRKAGCSPMLAVNLGTRGIEEATQYLEYCNISSEGKYSRMRAEYGNPKPYGIKTWCLGNEMDGDWQIGHKEASEYGRLAAEVSKTMKIMDPSIETVLCGSSLNTMETFPDWEAVVLDKAYMFADYISLHQYFGGQEKGSEAFLQQADSMTAYIETVEAVCEYIRAKKRTDKRMYISMDEWGVWAHAPQETIRQADEKRWQKAPAISEMVYTFQDALLFSEMLMSILKKSDIVKMACQSLLANVSAMIMTEEGGGLWKQTTYYPFMYMSRYGRGIVLDARCDDKERELDHVAVYDEESRELVIFAVNRNKNADLELAAELFGFQAENVIEHAVYSSADPFVTNQKNQAAVKPESCDSSCITKDGIISRLPAFSWNMIRIRIKDFE